MISVLMKRVIADFKQRFERNQFGLLKQIQMLALRQTEFCLLVFFNRKCVVILSYTFVKPRRNFAFAEIGIDDKMYISMKNRAVSFSILAFSRNRYVVGIVARLKISGDSGVRFSSISARQKRLVGGCAFENDEVRRNRRI